MEKVRNFFSTKNQLRMILIFLLVGYIPLLTFVGLTYEIENKTLSGIGWREGGLKFLLIYLAYSVPLMMFQIYLFLKLNNKKSKSLIIMALIGGLLIVAGALFPVKTDSPQYSKTLHSALCMTGSVIVMIVITFMFAIYCKQNKANTKKIILLAIGYGLILASIIIGVVFIQMAALFELVATLMLLTVMYLLNVSVYKQKTKESVKNAET